MHHNGLFLNETQRNRLYDLYVASLKPAHIANVNCNAARDRMVEAPVGC